MADFRRQRPKGSKKKDAWELRLKPDKKISPRTSIMLPPQRQSVTFPGELVRQIEADARRQHKSFSKAIVDYVRLGIMEEQQAKKRLRTVVNKIRNAATEEEASRYEDELAEAVFGPQQQARA